MVSGFVLSCEWNWPTLIRSQTVRAGAHGVILLKHVKGNFNFCGSSTVVMLS